MKKVILGVMILLVVFLGFNIVLAKEVNILGKTSIYSGKGGAGGTIIIEATVNIGNTGEVVDNVPNDAILDHATVESISPLDPAVQALLESGEATLVTPVGNLSYVGVEVTINYWDFSSPTR